MEKIIVGVFVSCIFIMWSTTRTYYTLKSIMHEIEQVRKQIKKGGDPDGG